MSDPKPLGLGSPRSWLTPLKPDGSGRAWESSPNEEIFGTHRAHAAGLNIRNPIPGYEYAWGSRDPRRHLIDRQRGYEVVRDTDPDGPAWRSGAIDPDHNAPTPMDTSEVYQDVVLLRIPAARLTENRRLEEAERIASLRAAERSFIDQMTSEEMLSGHGRNTRFAHSSHGFQVRDGDDVIESHQIPDVPIE